MGFYGNVMDDKEKLDWLKFAVPILDLSPDEDEGVVELWTWQYGLLCATVNENTDEVELHGELELAIKDAIKKQGWNYQINYYAPEDGHSSVAEIWKPESRSLRTFKQSGDTELEALMLAFREAMEAQQ